VFFLLVSSIIGAAQNVYKPIVISTPFVTVGLVLFAFALPPRRRNWK
jgi:hypothetical protein